MYECEWVAGCEHQPEALVSTAGMRPVAVCTAHLDEAFEIDAHRAVIKDLTDTAWLA